jgi:hypothetical protein
MLEYKGKLRAYESAVANGKADGMEMPIEPEEPVKPWLIINDFTMEALVDVLGSAVMDRGVMLYADEITSMIGSMDAYKSAGVKKDRGIFLSGRSGIYYSSIRKGRDMVCKNLSFSVLGAITDKKFQEMAPLLVDDGCLQRFFLCPVPVFWGQPVRRNPDLLAIANYNDLIGNLARSNALYNQPPFLFSKEAEKYNDEVFAITEAMSKLPYFPSCLREHASKLHGFYGGLVLTMHMIECRSGEGVFSMPKVDGQTVLPREVSAETARMARDLLIDYFIPHAMKLYTQNYGRDELDDAEAIANHILAHEPPYEVVLERDLTRSNSRKFASKNKLYEATDQLEAARWLIQLPPKNATEKTRRWKVSPDIYTKFAARREQEIAKRDELQRHLSKRHNVVRRTYPKK